MFISLLDKQKRMNSAVHGEQKQGQQAKNSRILSRKQIQKRLQGLKPQQYQKIINNLQTQNEKLKTEVKNLNQKVQDLIISKKITKIKNPQIQQQIGKMKRELDLKYQSMHHLKDQISKAKQSEMTEEMKMKIKQFNNSVMKCQKEYHQLQLEKQNLKVEIEKNEADLEEFIPKNPNDSKIQSLKVQNKQLRAKITMIKQKLVTQEKSSKNAIGKIYELKDEQKRTTMLKSTKLGTSLKELKSADINELQTLEKQIQELKRKKKNIENERVADRISHQAKKIKIDKEVREAMQAQKQLFKRRVKAVNQLNLYQRKQFQLKNQLEKSIMLTKIYQAAQSQTQKIVVQQFRKEWAGKSQGIVFNDAQILQYRGQTLIKGVTVYKNAENIVFLKFHYESPTHKKYQSHPPFDRSILKRCQAKKYESKTLSALKAITAFINKTSKRIVQIEFTWEDNDRAIIGILSEGDKEIIKLPFDIGLKEKPVCMFGTVMGIAKNSYVLESLGCQINSFDD